MSPPQTAVSRLPTVVARFVGVSAGGGKRPPFPVIPGLDPGIRISTVPRLIPGSSPDLIRGPRMTLGPGILMPVRLDGAIRSTALPRQLVQSSRTMTIASTADLHRPYRASTPFNRSVIS
jgi:hypothetical protein